MTNEWQEYVKDPRSVCKYGVKCYQKNPEHHAKYKHPPTSHNLKNQTNRNKQRFSPYRRDTKSPRANSEAATSKDTDPPRNTDNEPASNFDNKVATSKDDDSTTSINDKPITSTVHQPMISKDNKPITSKDDEPITNKDNEPTTSKESDPTSKYDSNKHNSNIIIESHKNVDNTTPIKQLNLSENITYHDPTRHELLQELFLTYMSPDFYKFYECLNEDNAIEKLLSSVNLELIGPYDLLRGKLPIVDDKELYLVHWRFFYDPPEFQSVLKKKGKSEYHIGYFRDDTNEKPVFLASNDSSKDYHIKPMAENIFGAVYLYLQNEKKSSPFISVACQKLMEKVKKYAADNDFSLDEYNMKKRQAKIVTKTFHGAGIVVPYNKKTQLGYRHLVENDASIKKNFTKLQAATSQKEKDSILSELQPVITYASIAMDECDFGTGLEAGIALFCSGLKELQLSALSSLTAAYSLLNRQAFSSIIQAHLKFRRKGPNMSLLALSDL